MLLLPLPLLPFGDDEALDDDKRRCLGRNWVVAQVARQAVAVRCVVGVCGRLLLLARTARPSCDENMVIILDFTHGDAVIWR